MTYEQFSHRPTTECKEIFYAAGAAGTLLYIKRPKIGLLPTGPLVRAVEQPPGNDLRLDFGGPLENIQDAGVAQDARDRKFKRKAVTAMHLHRIVGSCPGDPRREQF